MKPVGSFIIALAALVVGFACERSPIEPPPSVITADLLKQTGLLQCSVMPSQSVKQTIGPAGGTLKIGPHILVVPPGALATRVTIAAKSAGGTGNAVVLKPEGLTFLEPAYLTLSYANCDTSGLTASREVVYTTDSLVIIQYVPSSDNAGAKQVTGRLYHFSNYAVAW